MRWVVFKDTIKHALRPTILWAIGLVLMGFITLAAFPIMKSEALLEIVRSLPDFVLQMSGLTDESLMTTPEGFLAVGFFGKLVLIFAIYPVLMGLNVSANEEDAGIMDVLLSAPIDRRQFIVEKILAYSLMTVLLCVMLWVGMVAGAMVSDVQINFLKVAEMSLHTLPMMLFLMAMTASLGVILPRKQMVIVVMIAYVFAAFMLQTLVGMADSPLINAIGRLSIFTYNQPNDIVLLGSNWLQFGVVLALVVILTIFTRQHFTQREIAV
ncbi:hypothetical protein MASR2M15_08350 [Anaerolineales bacterium]